MKTVRLGELSFINALPLALPFTHCQGFVVEKTVAPPALLNQAILDGKLDISPVSSACYLRHKSVLTPIPDIALSAENPVQSVLLFLPNGLVDLKPDTAIAVPDTAETSIALMQHILKVRTGRYCSDFITYTLGDGLQWLMQGIPTLAIGDEALGLKAQFLKHHIQALDLAQAWQEETGLPFVFALWVTRKDWAKSHTDLVDTVHDLLLKRRELFETNLPYRTQLICQAKEHCEGLTVATIRSYYDHAISYRFGDAHQQALTRFEAILHELDKTETAAHERHRSQLPV